MLIHWCNCYSIKADTLAMIINVVGTDDGGKLIVHGMTNLLAHRDVISDESLKNLVAWKILAQGNISSIAAAMNRVEGCCNRQNTCTLYTVEYVRAYICVTQSTLFNGYIWHIVHMCKMYIKCVTHIFPTVIKIQAYNVQL